MESLLEQMEKWQKIDSTFASTAFTSIAQLVGSKFGKLGFLVLNVKNRLKTLKKGILMLKKFYVRAVLATTTPLK